MSYTKRGPFVNASATGPWVDAAFFNNVEAALVDASAGVIVAPAPTGVTTIDTPNLQTAFANAAATFCDLILTPSLPDTSGNVIRNYKVNAALSWNLNRGSLLGRGQVGLDFGPVPTDYVGPALTLTTNTSTFDGSHQSAMHRVQGIRLWGHNTDTSTMDGIAIVEGASMFGNDQGIVESCMVYAFHDNLTFGSNVWNFDFRKCTFIAAHRYNINLTGGTGECQQFTECNVAGASNATTHDAANVYSPQSQTVDARFYGGSFDYPGGGGGVLPGQPGFNGNGGIQGIIQGGSITFDKVHIEDGNTGPMFTYAANTSSTTIDVTFRDCFWSSTGGAFRDHIHEILPSTRDGIVIRFEGDKGSVGGNNAGKWLVDNSGITSSGIAVTYRGFNVINNGGSSAANQLQLGTGFGNLLTNGNFDTSTAFVSVNALGWSQSGTGAWTIQTASARSGNCLQVVGNGTAGGASVFQRARLSGGRRPVRALAFQQVTAYVSGSVGTYVRFYAEDGTTVIGSDYRLLNDESAAVGWHGKLRMITPPPGASFATVLCTYNSFQGTAQWDDIEVVEF